MARQRTVASRHAHLPPAAGGDAAPVGRDDLLGRLRRAVDEAVAGRGALLSLPGGKGIRKTTLLTEAPPDAPGAAAPPRRGPGRAGAAGLAPGYRPSGGPPG